MVTNTQPERYGTADAGRRNGVAISALVIGIVGLVISFWGVLSLVALVLGVVGLRRSPAKGERGHGQAIAGIVLGVIGVVWGILALVFGLQHYFFFVDH
ncbi:hypothetical protein DEI81_09475 [Curtobacterium sp. MCBD17_013]|uniref:DUF4190 domain-containing protein n=1 Tax=Curtobacterium sp. MCBD17_013 TaxID=2175668 RepID=UPI000DA7D972|nr:DUF4190 domain-containing protein [Curtobacterium sp. MCBD17_013]PZF62750.1 hypothetical protein DEI81_09475 [Curtobacterium sp. MCBD17_013]